MAKLVSRIIVCVVVVAVVLCAVASLSQAQETSCLNQLVPCLQYINSRKAPSSGCCDPLKSLIRSDPKCLCSMLGGNNSAGVNTTQAQILPARCGEKVSAALCSSPSKRKMKPGMKPSSSGADFSAANGVIVWLLLIVQTVWMSVIL